jgi:hypothetical protein
MDRDAEYYGRVEEGVACCKGGRAWVVRVGGITGLEERRGSVGEVMQWCAFGLELLVGRGDSADDGGDGVKGKRSV